MNVRAIASPAVVEIEFNVIVQGGSSSIYLVIPLLMMLSNTFPETKSKANAQFRGAALGAAFCARMPQACAQRCGVFGVRWNALLGPFLLPTQINLPMLRNAISQIQVDKALVRDSRFISHFFEVIDDILT